MTELTLVEKQRLIKRIVEQKLLAPSTSALGKKVGITGNSSFLRVCNETAGETAISSIFERICNAYELSGEDLQAFTDSFVRGQLLSTEYSHANVEVLSSLLYGGQLDNLEKGEKAYNFVLSTWFLLLTGYCSNNSFSRKDINKSIEALYDLFLEVMPEKKHLVSSAKQSFFDSVEMNLPDKQKYNWYDTVSIVGRFLQLFTNDNALRDSFKDSIVPDFLSDFTIWVNADDFSQPVGRILMLAKASLEEFKVGIEHGYISGWLFDSVNRELSPNQEIIPRCLQLLFFDKDEDVEEGVAYIGAQLEIVEAKLNSCFLALTGSQDNQSITLELFDRSGRIVPRSVWRKIPIDNKNSIADSKWGSFIYEFYQSHDQDFLNKALFQSYGIELVENKEVINVSIEKNGLRLDVYDEVSDVVTLYRWKTDKTFPFAASDSVFLITQRYEDDKQTFFKWLVSQFNSPDVSKMKQTTISWSEYEKSPLCPYYD